MSINSTKKGFTLIELLVVIAIIGILSSVVLASLNTARQKSRDAKRISDLKQLQLALELCYDQGAACSGGAAGEYPDGTAILATQGFIATVPVDPQGVAYLYDNLTSAGAACAVASGVCTTYVLGSTLEDTGHQVLGAGGADQSDATLGSVNCADPVLCVRP